jgi:ribosomal protein L31E
MQENHTIHLNNMVRIPRTRFANKVLYAVKNYVKKHTRAEDKNIRISNEVNAAIYARGKQHKLNRIDVAFKKKEDLLYVFLQNGAELKAFNTEKTKTAEKKTPAKKESKTEEKKTDATASPAKTGKAAPAEANPKKAATAPAK